MKTITLATPPNPTQNPLTDTTFPPLTGGGYPTTTNRTYWPTTGGAVAFQPGWFQGHATAFMYVNLGFGTDGPDGGPPNMSNPMVSPFQIIGPSKNPYPGTVCLPEVPLPANTTVQAGDNATIQVVEIAGHGAALYSVSLFPLLSQQQMNSLDLGFVFVCVNDVCEYVADG